MKKKIVAAASALAVAGAIALPAPATAQEIDGPYIAVACHNGVGQCVEDWVDYVGDTGGNVVYTACKVVFGPDCAVLP